jgi:hypothetical protein
MVKLADSFIPVNILFTKKAEGRFYLFWDIQKTGRLKLEDDIYRKPSEVACGSHVCISGWW